VQPAPICTLDGLAFDQVACFLGCQQAIFDGQCDFGKQLRVFLAGARWVTTKGMALRVEDGILHRDNDRGLFLVTCHNRYGPFCVPIEHVFRLTAGLMTYTLCSEGRADASTGTAVLNGWHSVARRYASKHTTMRL
jgi:hypothetical protein